MEQTQGASQENSQNKNLDFGVAIEAVKQGKIIARAGWNGKGMFVFQRPFDEIDAGTVINVVKSLPKAVKDYYQKMVEDLDVDFNYPSRINFSAYLCMKAADSTIVNGWLASQTDMLATDWEILDI